MAHIWCAITVCDSNSAPYVRHYYPVLVRHWVPFFIFLNLEGGKILMAHILAPMVRHYKKISKFFNFFLNLEGGKIVMAHYLNPAVRHYYFEFRI